MVKKDDAPHTVYTPAELHLAMPGVYIRPRLNFISLHMPNSSSTCKNYF